MAAGDKYTHEAVGFLCTLICIEVEDWYLITFLLNIFQDGVNQILHKGTIFRPVQLY